MTRRRLDAELVRRNLAPSREAAQRLIADGTVLVDGSVATKAARQVDGAQAVTLTAPPPPFVSRAGGKLSDALDRFGLDVDGLVVLDAGSSTGGFTDCVLQRGAVAVTAVDVGTNQLHEKLRSDERVTVRERTDIRNFVSDRQFDIAVGDLSFISLRKVLDPLVKLVVPGGPMVLLVKPQFEAGRVEAARGKGVITDRSIWSRVLGEVADHSLSLGAGMIDCVPSSVTGTAGNQEFVALFEIGAEPSLAATAAAIERAVQEVSP